MSDIIDNRLKLVVTHVWLNAFTLFGHAMVTLTMFGVTIFVAGTWGAVICASILLVNLIIMIWRSPQTYGLVDMEMDAQDGWKNFMLEATARRACITAHRCGPTVGTMFKQMHARYNKANFKAAYYFMTTDLLSQWLAVVVLCAAYITVGLSVTEGSLHKGDFVVLLGTLIKFQSQIGTLYTDLQSLRSAYVPISKLAELLNANTRRKQLRKGASRREIVMQKVYEQFPDFKEQAIYVAPNTVVEYHTVTDSRSIVKRVKFPAAGLNIELGQMNCLLSTASGKATFLKSIARFLLPVEGFVHYPENLRVRFLSADIHIFNNSLMMNLRFGGQKDPDGEQHTIVSWW